MTADDKKKNKTNGKKPEQHANKDINVNVLVDVSLSIFLVQIQK